MTPPALAEEYIWKTKVEQNNGSSGRSKAWNFNSVNAITMICSGWRIDRPNAAKAQARGHDRPMPSSRLAWAEQAGYPLRDGRVLTPREPDETDGGDNDSGDDDECSRRWRVPPPAWSQWHYQGTLVEFRLYPLWT
jgi:hypothetical protein